jgi:hypothetical protein
MFEGANISKITKEKSPEEIENLKKIVWWKRYPEYNFINYKDVEEWIEENGIDKAKKIAEKYDDEPATKKLYIQKLMAGEILSIDHEIRQYFLDKKRLNEDLQKEGRKNEIVE